MDIKKHFEYNPPLDLTAAHIGINKWNWLTIDNEDEEAAKKLMKLNRFDVLPIKNENDEVIKFYSTRVWNNYDNLNLNIVDQSNSIYYRLSFSDLIRKFKEDNKHYYFLTNHKDTLGLVSYANLNCQEVYNYLFQIIADIEKSIVHMLKDFVNQEEIIIAFRNSEDNHLKEVAQSFNTAFIHGADNTIFEHMFFQTVGITLNKFQNKLPDHFKKLKKYSPKFSANGTYGELRNTIMHPVRPILKDSGTINKIDELFTDYLNIKEILR